MITGVYLKLANYQQPPAASRGPGFGNGVVVGEGLKLDAQRTAVEEGAFGEFVIALARSTRGIGIHKGDAVPA